MTTITKRDIIIKIADKTKYTQTNIKKVIQAFLEEVIKELSNGNKIELRDFAVFATRKRATRTARNPRTGEIVKVPARTVVTFKPGKIMREKTR